MGDTLTIREVPEDAHSQLLKRASLHDQSMQAYLRAYLTALASKPDMKTLIENIRQWKRHAGVNVPTETILADLRAERE